MTVPDLPAAAPRRGRRPAQGAPVIDRALALMDAFDPAHRRLTLSELARRSGVPLSTTSRLAARLVAWGALDRDIAGTYSVGLRLWEVASLAEPALGLREVAQPFLDDLNAVTRQHAQLAILDGHDAVVLDRRMGRADLPVNYRVGGRLPVVPTAVGHVLLAYAPSEITDEVLDGHFGWPLHECPRPAAREVRAELADVRQRGVAVVTRPTSPVVSVAVPIRVRGGAVVAALGVITATGTVDPARLEPVLRTTALGISRSLGTPRQRPAYPAWSY